MNFPVLITQQGETIAVAYDQAGIELAVQEHYVEPDIYLVGIGFMKAEFSDGMSCDLEEVVVYPYDGLGEQQPTPEVEKLVEALEQGFPLLSDDGLDEVEHHCEWVIQRERKRVHSILATHRKQGGEK